MAEQAGELPFESMTTAKEEKEEITTPNPPQKKRKVTTRPTKKITPSKPYQKVEVKPNEELRKVMEEAALEGVNIAQLGRVLFAKHFQLGKSAMTPPKSE